MIKIESVDNLPLINPTKTLIATGVDSTATVARTAQERRKKKLLSKKSSVSTANNLGTVKAIVPQEGRVAKKRTMIGI